MKELKRYDVGHDGFGATDSWESKDGYWCPASDALAIQAERDQLAKQLQKNPQIKWTSEKPTEPGWYFRLSHEHEMQAVHVFNRHGTLLFRDEHGYIPVSNIACQWSTKIPEPQL